MALNSIHPAESARQLTRGDDAGENSPLGIVLTSLRHWFWGVAAISFMLNLLTLTGPLFMLQVYDRVLVSGSVPTLVALGSLALALYLFFGVLEALRGRLLFRIGQQVDAKLSAQTFSLSTMIPNWFGARGGRLRPVEDLDTFTRFMSGRGPAAIFDMPWLPFYLVLVFLFHWILGLVALTGAVSICALAFLNELKCRKPALLAAHLRGRRGSLVDESRRNAETVHAMGMSDALWEHWNTENATFLERQRGAADWSGFFSSTTRTVRFILQSAILATGAWLAIRHEISPGVMIACSIMTSRALAPVEQAVGQWRGFISARQSFQRLRTMLPAFEQLDPNVELPLPNARVVIEQLYCCPGGMQAPVVQGVSLDLKAGDGVAILGPSGAGKSTLVRAIIGTASVLKGDIRFDGATLDQWPAGVRGKFIGYLPQDLQLFDGTVAQNIARFDPQASSAAIIEAAMHADVHGLIVGLPNGYDTLVGAGGMTLSGGQRQRIALARALYRNPFLIVLDEPNANLDAEGENALAGAITAMRDRGSIVIVVAHRPRVIGAIDMVLCLKEGRVAAYGPRDEIMRKTLMPVRARERA